MTTYVQAPPLQTSNRLLVGGIGVGFASLTGQAATAGLYLLSARYLGPHKFGLAFSLLSLSIVLVDLVDFGAGLHDTRALARDPAYDWVSNFARKLGAACVVEVIWQCLCPIAFHGSSGSTILSQLMGLTLLGQLCITSLQPINRVRGKLGPLVLAILVERPVALAAFVAATTAGLDARVALPAAILTGQVASVVVLLHRGAATRLPRPRLKGYGEQIARCRHFGLANVATDASQLQVNVAALVGGPVTAGLFAAASRLASTLNTATNGLGPLLLPGFASRGEPARSRLLRQMLLVTGAIAAVGGGLLALLSGWLVPHLLGSSYKQSVSVLRILILGACLAALTQPLQMYLQASGHEGLVSRVTLLGSGFALASMAILTPSCGLLGAGAASVSNVGITLAGYCLIMRRRRS